MHSTLVISYVHNKPCCPLYTHLRWRMMPCCLLPTCCPTVDGEFSELENSEVVPTVCTTDLLPRLAAAAALLATMLQPLSSSSSSRQSLKPDTVFALKHSTSSILGLWHRIVGSDNKEEGFTIAEPKCVAALPSICALVRAALCVLPTKKSSVDRMVPDRDVMGQCMAVANFASGHVHMQVGVAVHAMYVHACMCMHVASLCVCACQHSSQSTGQLSCDTSVYRVCSKPTDVLSAGALVSTSSDLPVARLCCFARCRPPSRHLPLQYCKAFMNPAPERGCSRATAHMLARCEDYQWVL